ncbi:MAG: DMT family transporter [Oscillospiraceae bacterium]|nr:DMT family transporter [Oscillospiraceae bacterium]
MNIGKLIKGYIAVILSAVLYGCMPLMAKFIYADGVNPMTLVFLRNFLALPVIALMAYGQCKTLKIPKKLLPAVSTAALFGSCITPVLLFSSYQFIDGGTATVIHFIYPAVVVLASFLLKKDRPNWGNVTSVILCFGGICLFYNPGAPMDWRGLTLAAISGFTYATYVLLLSDKKAKQVPSFLYAFYVALTCSVVMLITCLATGQLALPQTLFGWGVSTAFALGITCGAVVLFQLGTFLIGGQQSAILSALEPITSVVVDVVIFHKLLGLQTGIGVALVVSATVLLGVYNFIKVKKQPARK